MQVNELLSKGNWLSSANRALSLPAKRLLLLSIIALTAIVIFMTINLRGNIQYILVHRGLILATMLLVAFAAGVATVLFQTVTNNRILTPSVMGLEALFILIQTMLVFFVDADGFRVLGITGKFLCESALLLLLPPLVGAESPPPIALPIANSAITPVAAHTNPHLGSNKVLDG